jgi:hypothetical protein
MVLTGLMLGLGREMRAGEVPPPPNMVRPSVEPLIMFGKPSARSPGTYSAGVAEIIQMLDAGVEPPVLLAYIQRSCIPYEPDATELITLKDRGASTEILLALLHRGDQVRVGLLEAPTNPHPPPAARVPDYILHAINPADPEDEPVSEIVPEATPDANYTSTWPVGISWYVPPGTAQGRRTLHPGDRRSAGGGDRRYSGAAEPASRGAPAASDRSHRQGSHPGTPSHGIQGSGRSGQRPSGGRAR